MEFFKINTHNEGCDGGLIPGTDADKAVMVIREKIQSYDFVRILMNMIVGLDVTNEYLKNAYVMWMKLKMEGVSVEEKSYLSVAYDKTSMFIVHDLRVIIDKMIAIVWCHDNDGNCKRIKIDGIDAYLSKNNKNYRITSFEKHREYITTISLLDNADKHSLVNLDNRRFGIEEPCVYGMYNNHNNYEKECQDIIVSMNDIILGFNGIYEDFLKLINEKW